MSDIEYIFSDHAIEQFMARINKNKYNIPKKPERYLRKLLAKSREEKIDPAHKVKRLINHGFKPVEYRVAEGWRFVVANGVVFTIERVNPDQN